MVFRLHADGDATCSIVCVLVLVRDIFTHPDGPWRDLSSSSNHRDYDMMDKPKCFPAEDELLDQIYAVEVDSYPAEEAATKAKLLHRFHQAPDTFLIAIATTDDTYVGIAGFICATRSRDEVVTHDSMQHTCGPEGTTVAIHSVVTEVRYRRQGLAKEMLKRYTGPGANIHNVERFALMCKEKNISLYRSVGFSLHGQSMVEHGADLWHDMIKKA